MSAHLVLDALSRRFAGSAQPAVDALSLSLPRGAFLALLGPSGCGKTTTLRMIAGLEPPDGGRISVAGQDVTALPPHRRNMGVVFQSYALFPHLTAAANVGFGLAMRGVARGERAARVAEALAMVGLGELARRKPRTLSGGQQQRVAVARALAPRPDLLLLDEPLSALDAKLRDELRDELRALQRRLGITTVFVTHDQDEALSMADIVAVMERGRIEQLGTPEEVFERPATRFVATFLGRAARIRADIMAPGMLRAPGGIALRAAATPAQGAVEAFLRPHRVRLLAEGETAEGCNVLPGTLARRTYLGDSVSLEVATAVGPLLAGLAGGVPVPADGAALRLAFRPEDLRVFAA